VSDQAFPGLVIRSSDNSAFLLPMFFDGVSADHAELQFEHVGGKYFLSEVKTPAGVYAIRTPRPMIQVAQMKDQGAMSSSGTN
jgi:cbb3-type cytochrome oxidase subunit 1